MTLPTLREFKAVLGLDAAWSARHPSGVSLVSNANGGWTCVAAAPSYEAFLKMACGCRVNWNERSPGGPPDPVALLAAAKRLLNGQPVSLVAVDMPLSRQPITGRREADNSIACEFARCGCAPHTPGPQRPGPLGENLTREFEAAGYRLITHGAARPDSGVLLEVYPHPALLRLLQKDYRWAYKVSKTTRYWPGAYKRDRIRMVIKNLRSIHRALNEQIGLITFLLPTTASCLATLKSYEDTLDSLVCAWVGIRYLEGKAVPYGDVHAAIWVPD